MRKTEFNFNSDELIYESTCFDPYWNKYKPENFIFKRYYNYPIVIPLLDFLKDKFNIEYEIEKVPVYYGLSKFNPYYKKIYSESTGLTKYNEIPAYHVKVAIPQLLTDNNKDKAIKYFIHHMVRMTSVFEDFVSYNIIKDLEFKDPIDFIIYINNHSYSSYRSLSGVKILKEILLYGLDNLDRIPIGYYSWAHKQTSTYKSMFLLYFNDHLEKDKIYKLQYKKSKRFVIFKYSENLRIENSMFGFDCNVIKSTIKRIKPGKQTVYFYYKTPFEIKEF